ncbi:cadherin repeat domain-containing protein, partial [Paucibacter sp. XJ19-41]|uniref:cadherin repeat domain-containing protein n=1 Tax=Paucibacter sp. XJ19-41 TaxID=2927824 RepID=UPI0023498EBF
MKRSTDGSLSKQSTAMLLKINAEAGAQYALLDPSSGKPVPGLLLKRKGNALLVELEGEQLEIENFYGEPGVAFLPTGTPGDEEAMGAAITPMSPAQTTLASGEQLIWSAASDDAAGYLPQLIGGGLLGLGLIADGSGGASTAAPEPEPPAAVANFVKGTIVGGPVIAGNGLTVAVFAADGVSKLGEAKVNPDGSFSIAVGSYIGVVIARVVDSDTGADYLDEASGVGKDLNAELFSIEVVRTPNTTVTVNLNVLTTLAYHKAVEQAGSAALTTAVVDGVNKSVATLFGLEALHGTTVQTTNGGAFNAVDGLSQGETYGLILAAFSGADVANGGNSQQTVNEVLAGLTLSGGTATLAPTAQAGLIEGGKVVVENTGLDLGDEVSVIVDTVAPQFGAPQVALSVDENVAAGRLLHTANATDPSSVRYSLKAVGDHTAFSINASTGAVSLVGSPDFESKASYSLAVIATDAAGNASEQTLSVTVNNLDESAPSISSGAQAGAVVENSGAGQVVYTASSTDAGDIAT